MADINGYLKSAAGIDFGTTSNPVYVTFSTTSPQQFYTSEVTVPETIIKYITIENLAVRPPKGLLERLWQKLGYYMGWI